MTLRNVSVCLLLLLSAPRLNSQVLPGRRILLSEINGTPLSNISTITEDRDGFLWLGSTYGLFRFDGTSLQPFANRPDDSTSVAPGPFVQVLNSARYGGLWVGSTTGGVSFLNLKTLRARSFVARQGNANALTSNEVAGLYEDPDGGLWIGTAQFALHYLSPQERMGGGALRCFRPPLPANTADWAAAGALGEIVADPHDPQVLWIGSRRGLYRFNRRDQSFRLFPFKTNPVFWYRPLNVQLVADDSGALWCGTSVTGLCRLDPETGEWEIFKKNVPNAPLQGANTILDILRIAPEQLLVLTSIDDAWTVDCRRRTVEFLNIDPVAPSGFPCTLYTGCQTSGGDVWLAYSLGVIRLTTQRAPWPMVSFIAKNPALDRNNWQRSYALSPDGRTLYMGTLRGNGLLAYDIQTEKTEVFSYRKPERPEDSDVFMDALCFDARGRLWIGTEEGLLFLNEQRRRLEMFSGTGPDFERLRGAHIAALAAHGDTLWIGARGRGLFSLRLQSGEVQTAGLPGAGQNGNVSALQVDRQGRLWAGHDRGLSLCGPQPRLFNSQTRPPAGLSNDQVTQLALDEAGHLWVSTLGGGLLRMRNAGAEKPWFDVYYNSESPGGDLVYDFTLCPRGKVWLSAQSGLAVLDTATRVFVNYDSREGMMSKIGVMIRVPDGRIASAAHRGFHFFHPDTLMHSSAAPVPYLKQFKVFDKDTKLPFQINYMSEIHLAYDQNHFSLEMGALNFEEKALTRFSYRLEGYDREWVQSGERQYLSYTNLPAGAYTLRVKAANKHGMWSAREKSIRIVIHPPYWQTWWFRLLTLGVLSALGYALLMAWRQRKRTLQAQAAVSYFAAADYSKSTVREILWDVAHKCMARLDLEDCVIYLLDESGETLVQEAAFGAKSPELYHLNDPLRIPLGRGIVGSAGLKGQPECVPDTRLDRRYIVDDRPRLSELAVPILHDGRVIGVIDSEHSRRGFFTEHHVQVLKTIASLCADKIAKARAAELVQEKERQLAELNRNLAESQLTALRAQMNPHFLFNSLNSINWYIIKNRPAEASRYIAKFSRLIRLILEHSKVQLISLAQELEALKLYLDMEAMRFEDRFDYRIDLAPGLDPDDLLVPPLVFQPYVENAVWHGLMPKKGPGKLTISLREERSYLFCTIEDDGIGRAAAAENTGQRTLKHPSQGLKITEARIRQLNGGSNGTSPVHFTDLFDAEGKAAGTRVEVRIREEGTF